MTTDDRIRNRLIETIRGRVYVGFALCSLTKREREGENEDENLPIDAAFSVATG